MYVKKCEKIIIAVILSIIMVAICGNASAFSPAPSFEDGFAYFDGSTVFNITSQDYMTLGKFIWKWHGDDAVLEIPAELGGVEMEELSSGAVEDCDTLTTVILPASPMEVKGAAFKNCPNLQKVVIHDELQINDNPFVECPALQEVVLDENAKRYGLIEGNLYNLETMSLLIAFQNEAGTFVVPEGTLRIAGRAYSNAKDITSIALPDGLTQIGFYAFAECKNLQEVQLPNTLTSIELGAFYECKSLEELVLPESLEYIRNAAFIRCDNLRTVYIPAGVSEIGASAFNDYPKLQLIVEKGSYAEKWANENGVTYMFANESNSKKDIFEKFFGELSQKSPSELFASGAVFDIVRQNHEVFEQVVRSNDALSLQQFFAAAYSLFCNNPGAVGFSPSMVDINNNDTDPRYWNADTFSLPNGDAAALCYMSIQNDSLAARIFGIVLSDQGDRYYYCMLNKDENVLSDVMQNKALNGIEKVGEVKGRGFDLMYDFLACMS